MRISVITVSYNSAATIKETLQSVAMQTHVDIEHLVIDGASSDETLAIVQMHGGRVAVIVSEPDKGIYDAMNKGIRLATGDFVGFLNADDTFANVHAIHRIACVARSSTVDLVYGDLLYVDKHRTDKAVRYWRSGTFKPSKLRFGWMPPHPTLYVRRTRLLELGPFDSSFRIAADYEFVLRYFSHPGMGVVYVPSVLVKMRTGGVSNRSIGALMEKSREDLQALRAHKAGGTIALAIKNARKLSQFIVRPKIPVE